MQMGHDDLQIVAEIAKGAYGVVYRGVWRGMTVAVKRLVFQHLTGKEGDEKRKVGVSHTTLLVYSDG